MQPNPSGLSGSVSTPLLLPFCTHLSTRVVNFWRSFGRGIRGLPCGCRGPFALVWVQRWVQARLARVQAIEIVCKGLSVSAVCRFGDSALGYEMPGETRSAIRGADPCSGSPPRAWPAKNRPGWGGGTPLIGLSPPIFTFLLFFAAFFREFASDHAARLAVPFWMPRPCP